MYPTSAVEQYTITDLTNAIAMQRSERKKAYQEQAGRESRINRSTLLYDLIFFKAKADNIEQNTGQGQMKFSDYFVDALIGAFFRYQTTKKKAWSGWLFFGSFVGILVSPLLATIVLKILDSIISGGQGSIEAVDSTTISYTQFTMTPSVIVVVMFIVTAILLYAFSKWWEYCAYRETWVRHSTRYGRLRLALSRFLFSEQDAAAYKKLQEETFAVLEQNYDQFVTNLSSHGMAKRSKIEEGE